MSCGSHKTRSAHGSTLQDPVIDDLAALDALDTVAGGPEQITRENLGIQVPEA